jgi:hypothetical protein
MLFMLWLKDKFKLYGLRQLGFFCCCCFLGKLVGSFLTELNNACKNTIGTSSAIIYNNLGNGAKVVLPRCS